MGGRFLGRPCTQRLIVGQLRALQRNCAVHHLSPSPVLPIRKAIANASRLRSSASAKRPCRRQNASSADAEGKRAPPTTQGLGLYSTSHLVEPQHRNSVDVAGFLGCCHPTRSDATPRGRNAAPRSQSLTERRPTAAAAPIFSPGGSLLAQLRTWARLGRLRKASSVLV